RKGSYTMKEAFLTPYLYFGRNCREAMNAYQDILGGELTVMTFGEIDPNSPDYLRDQVMHASIVEGPIELMACDDTEGKTYGLGNVRLALHGSDQSTLAGWFEQLSDGGSVIHELEPQMWGDTYGE